MVLAPTLARFFVLAAALREVGVGLHVLGPDPAALAAEGKSGLGLAEA